MTLRSRFRRPSLAAVACLAWLTANCTSSPEPLGRDPAAAGTWTSKAQAYNATLDGGPTYDGGAFDAGQLPDLPADVVPLTDVPVADLAVTDVPVTDLGVADVPPDVAPDVPQWPAGTLQVVSAFSPDGKSVKLRFNKPVDPKSVDGATFDLLENNQPMAAPFTSKAVAADPTFVTLGLSPQVIAKINPQLTYKAQAKGLKAFDGEAIDTTKNKANVKRTVYLQLLWHQHQPTYLDPIADQLTSPWVRHHATKDYYDMASVLEPYPNIHVTINVTPVLLYQLIPYYLERLGPFVDVKKNSVDSAAFLAKWKGHTDPWIDLLLEPTPDPKTATEKQLGLLYADPWSCVSTAPVLMNRFPAYAQLRDKNPATLTKDDLLGLKIWFTIAWMDPDFLHGAVTLATGDVVDMTDIIQASAKENATFTLKVPYSEQLANRLVAESYKIMKAVIPIHQKMAYDADTFAGQIEIATTPFYHPILPLVQHTELMKEGQPFDPRPTPAFNYPADAAAQVGRAVAYYESVFGSKPRGMWPGEGSVAEEVVGHFLKYGVLWVATDAQVMQKSGQSPGGDPVTPFRVDTDKQTGSSGQNLAVYFRNTNMSNDIGFAYQGKTGDEASNDLIKNVAAQAPGFGAPDRVVTLVLDGENAWETFSKEHDGKGFFHKLYSKLEASQAAGEIITVTGSEYLLGNPKRNVPAHPVAQLPELEPLFPGSWIGGTFEVWAGETEENTAWGYLLTARKDLEKSGLAQPDPLMPVPADKTSVAYHVWMAFDEIYAAEGSDWFWWYGADMTSPSNDDSPFDASFRTHLAGMYAHMNAALKLQGKAEITAPTFKPIIQANPQAPQGPLEPPPLLDGQLLPNESEWSQKGGFFFDSDTAGALASPDDWMATIYYGFGKLGGKDGVFLGVQHNFDLQTASGGLGIYFSHKHIVDAATGKVQEDPATMQGRTGEALAFKGKGASREVWIGLQGGKATTELRKWNGSGPWTSIAAGPFGGQVGGPVKGGKLLEVFVPLTDLGIVAGDPLEVQLAFVHGGKAKDLAPSLESKQLVDDPTSAVFVTFVVDATGNVLALDTYNPICNPPPPKGKGIVYIAGNDPKLGMKAKWVPNKVALRDDGKEGDAKAGDGKWSGVFTFPKGASLKYKYTIGLPSNEGQWGCTEEFPLTERGLEVSKDPKVKKVLVEDVFADRPPVTGQQGVKTLVTASE